MSRYRPREPKAALTTTGWLHWTVVVLMGFAFTPLHAQSAAPFSTLRFTAGAVADVNIGRLANYWEGEPGAMLRVATPFYLGATNLALVAAEFESLAPAQPDFELRTLTLGWGMSAPVGAALTVGAGGHVGSAFIDFEDEEGSNSGENEFAAGLEATLSLALWRGLGATAQATRRRIFTRVPIDLTSVALGLAYTVRTPGPLRDFLD